jgi:predicted GNAT family N-acyltransferase
MFDVVCKMNLDVKIAKDESEVATCMRLRRAVFIKEQNVAEHEEVDGQDQNCTHVLAIENGIPAGAARFQQLGSYVKIQRVCVPKEHRGHGIGAKVIKFIVVHVSNSGGITSIRLGAQTHALEFYHKLGFIECSKEYLDAGILHRDMDLRLS